MVIFWVFIAAKPTKKSQMVLYCRERLMPSQTTLASNRSELSCNTCDYNLENDVLNYTCSFQTKKEASSTARCVFLVVNCFLVLFHFFW